MIGQRGIGLCARNKKHVFSSLIEHVLAIGVLSYRTPAPLAARSPRQVANAAPCTAPARVQSADCMLGNLGPVGACSVLHAQSTPDALRLRNVIIPTGIAKTHSPSQSDSVGGIFGIIHTAKHALRTVSRRWLCKEHVGRVQPSLLCQANIVRSHMKNPQPLSGPFLQSHLHRHES